MTYSPINALGSYLEPNIELPKTSEQLAEIMTYRELETATILNNKENAFYDLQESLTGQQWFTSNPQVKRQTFRKVVEFGTLPNSSTKLVAHGISGASFFTKIYATASNGGTFIPIPFASTIGEHIEIYVTATDVGIVTASDRTAYSAYVVLEYLKN